MAAPEMCWRAAQSDQSLRYALSVKLRTQSFLLVDSEDWSAQADLSLRWAHMPFCWFCHEAAQILWLQNVKNSKMKSNDADGRARGLVARLDACLPGIQMVAGLIVLFGKTFFRQNWSWNHFCGHSLPTADSSRAVVSYWWKDGQLVLVNRLGLRLPRKIVVRLIDCLDMTIVVDWDVEPQNKQTKWCWWYDGR